MKKYISWTIISLVPGILLPSSFSQDDSEEEILELSPFVVDSSNDRGYRAANTLAGTRLNSSLNDVASSISVFTEAFIEDLGIQDIEELSDYTTNMTLNYGEDQVGGVLTDRQETTATSATKRINIRGIPATQGMDYFRSITPSDGYRVGRYDSARGPNSILFGLSNAGGIVNSTSTGASTVRNSGRIRLSTEDNGGLRSELRVNRVLVEDKLALAVAVLNQGNKDWKVGTYDDSDRIFGTLTYKANEKLTLRVNYETGDETVSNQTRAPALDFGGMALYDWNRYLTSTGGDLNTMLGTSELTVAGNGNEGSRWVNAADEFVGVVQRNTNPRTQNRRYVFASNDAVLYDDAGNWFWRGYGDQRYSAPPDANWENGSVTNGGRPRVPVLPDLLPLSLNTDGPGAYKEWDFENYTFFADYQLADNLFINFSHNHQKTDLLAYNIGGFAFQLNADVNLTRGMDFSLKESWEAGDETLAFDGSGGSRNPNFGPNPYAGMWYLESNWRRDTLNQETEASRVSASYELNGERFGNHQFAIMFARSEEFFWRTNQQLGFLGRPFNTHWNNPGNRVEVRTYFDFDDPAQNPDSFHVAHWDTLHGTKHMIDGQELEIGWTHRIPGGGNRSGTQDIDTKMFAMHNKWLNDKLVTTFGIRQDDSDLLQYRNIWSSSRELDLENGITESELLSGPQPDFDVPELGDRHVFDKETSVLGVVYHITDQFSLVAGRSDSVGFPDFNRTLIPLGNATPPPDGEGLDYGISFRLFEDKLAGRLVYYETDETNVSTGTNNNGQYDRLVNLASAVVDEGIISQTDWDALDAERHYVRDWTGDIQDKRSRGVELSMTANFTKNWRMSINAKKTDRVTTNSRKNMEAHYGMLPDANSPLEWDQVIYPFDANNNLVDASGLASDGVFSQLIEHFNSLLGTNTGGDATRWEEITTTGSNTAGSDMEIIIRNLNVNRVAQHKKWGLRPYAANVWTTYDFDEGFLKGFSLGGGVSWQDNMIIGEDEVTLEEWQSRELWNTNLMLRYKWKSGLGPLDGPVTLQLNVANVLDDDDIIPVSYLPSRGPIYEYPYDRGFVYSRYDVPEGRSWRMSATYEF